MVTGVASSVVGDIAFSAAIALDELTPQRASLEQAFMELTRDSVDFAAGGGPAPVSVDASPFRQEMPR